MALLEDDFREPPELELLEFPEPPLEELLEDDCLEPPELELLEEFPEPPLEELELTDPPLERLLEEFALCEEPPETLLCEEEDLGHSFCCVTGL